MQSYFACIWLKDATTEGGALRPSREVKCGPRAGEVCSTRRSCLFSERGRTFVQQKHIISSESSTSQIIA